MCSRDIIPGCDNFRRLAGDLGTKGKSAVTHQFHHRAKICNTFGEIHE